MNHCRRCSHERKHHIHEEGACRPGFQCEVKCEKFSPERPDLIDEAYQHGVDDCVLVLDKYQEFHHKVETDQSRSDAVRAALAQLRERLVMLKGSL